jgi:hypothetical protein
MTQHTNSHLWRSSLRHRRGRLERVLPELRVEARSGRRILWQSRDLHHIQRVQIELRPNHLSVAK